MRLSIALIFFIGLASPFSLAIGKDISPLLDSLFSRLAASGDEAQASGIVRQIEARWAHSGSDTSDLLLERATQALAGADAPLAVELLDKVLALSPDWAEAWARRGILFSAMNDSAGATADLGQALAREPRRYDAWAILGKLALAHDDKKRAFEAYRRVLVLHPWHAEARRQVDRLRNEVKGRDI